jgi:hypothetical protein
MNWAMPCTKSRIGTAAAAASLIAISGLFAPALALATPTPTNLSFQTDNNKIGTSIDGFLSAHPPLPMRRGHDRDRDRDRDDYYDDDYDYHDGQGYY